MRESLQMACHSVWHLVRTQSVTATVMVPQGWDLGKPYRMYGVSRQGLFCLNSNLGKKSIRQSIKCHQLSQDLTRA